MLAFLSRVRSRPSTQMHRWILSSCKHCPLVSSASCGTPFHRPYSNAAYRGLADRLDVSQCKCGYLGGEQTESVYMLVSGLDDSGKGFGLDDLRKGSNVAIEGIYDTWEGRFELVDCHLDDEF